MHPHNHRLATVVALLLGACGPGWRLPLESTGPASARPATGPAASEETRGAVSPSTIAAARDVLLPRLEELPGFAVAVAAGGEVAWDEGFGWADLGSRRPATPHTRFAIYSDSKPITATLAMRLQEQGRLRLDAPIGRYVPELPAPLAALTLEQLLAHSAGVRHYANGEWPRLSRTHCATTREALSPFLHDPLVATPGAEFHYSSFGYVLASAVLEGATHTPFAELLRDEILQPAKMADTTFAPPPADGSTATGYEPHRFGRVGITGPWDNSCKLGAGALLSSAHDLARFGAAVLDGTLVSSAGRQALFEPRASAADYGLGWGRLDGEALGTLLAHSGGSPGGRAYLLLDPQRQLVVAITANLEGESLAPEARAVLAAFATAPQDRPRK